MRAAGPAGWGAVQQVGLPLRSPSDGRMQADLSVNGAPTSLDTRSIAVWVNHGAQWRFLAYQGTPAPTRA